MDGQIYVEPDILFLEGVFIKDITNLILDKLESYEDDELNDESDIPYDKIPNKYICKDDWPTTTNLLCWHCSRRFEDAPLFISIRDKTNRDGKREIVPYGNFCSPFCAIVVIENEFEKNTHWGLISLLINTTKEIRGRDISTPIRHAKAKTEMIQYGGNLTPDEYKSHIDELWNTNNLSSIDSMKC